MAYYDTHSNFTPDDVRFGSGEAILNQRKRLMARGMAARREHYSRTTRDRARVSL